MNLLEYKTLFSRKPTDVLDYHSDIYIIYIRKTNLKDTTIVLLVKRSTLV